jgi:hypothetical protein
MLLLLLTSSGGQENEAQVLESGEGVVVWQTVVLISQVLESGEEVVVLISMQQQAQP